MLLTLHRKQVFVSRQKVEFSGIYRVIHDHAHVRSHLVTAARGDSFPPCKNKLCHPRFVLLKMAPHVSDHPDFVAPPSHSG